MARRFELERPHLFDAYTLGLLMIRAVFWSCFLAEGKFLMSRCFMRSHGEISYIVKCLVKRDCVFPYNKKMDERDDGPFSSTQRQW